MQTHIILNYIVCVKSIQWYTVTGCEGLMLVCFHISVMQSQTNKVGRVWVYQLLCLYVCECVTVGVWVCVCVSGTG